MKALLPLMIILAGAITPAYAHPGGGWDLNNVKVSVSRSKLIEQDTKSTSKWLGGWDGNNAKVSVAAGSKLLSK
jgi:hypothetical protein